MPFRPQVFPCSSTHSPVLGGGSPSFLLSSTRWFSLVFPSVSFLRSIQSHGVPCPSHRFSARGFPREYLHLLANLLSWRSSSRRWFADYPRLSTLHFIPYPQQITPISKKFLTFPPKSFVNSKKSCIFAGQYHR